MIIYISSNLQQLIELSNNVQMLDKFVEAELEEEIPDRRCNVNLHQFLGVSCAETMKYGGMEIVTVCGILLFYNSSIEEMKRFVE